MPDKLPSKLPSNLPVGEQLKMKKAMQEFRRKLVQMEREQRLEADAADSKTSKNLPDKT